MARKAIQRNFVRKCYLYTFPVCSMQHNDGNDDYPLTTGIFTLSSCYCGAVYGIANYILQIKLHLHFLFICSQIILICHLARVPSILTRISIQFIIIFYLI
jgi:hypothetical protein